jgi:hypothetical protein
MQKLLAQDRRDLGLGITMLPKSGIMNTTKSATAMPPPASLDRACQSLLPAGGVEWIAIGPVSRVMRPTQALPIVWLAARLNRAKTRNGTRLLAHDPTSKS